MILDELIAELERQKPLIWDERLNSSKLEMILAEEHAKFQINGKETPFFITSRCHEQVAERLEIPVRYYHRMIDEAPDLLAANVNAWLTKRPKEIFLRGNASSVRAFLSDRYRVIDHLDVLYCALNELQAHEAEVDECYLSETEMNLKIRSNHLKDFVRHKDDLLIGGILLTNSETGHRALRVEPRTFRVQCSNGMVIEELVARQVHLGNGGNGQDEEVYLSLRRSIREIFSRFGEIILALREATEIKISNPPKVIKNVVEHYRLSEEQREGILMAFGAEAEADQYGIANAVTRAAKAAGDWLEGLELERIGGKIITLSKDQFKSWDE